MPAKRYYRGADIPMRVIRRYARQVAEGFHLEKIILSGSRANGNELGCALAPSRCGVGLAKK